MTASENRVLSLFPSSPVGGTPMIRQYQEIKQKYPECLLLFRLGDFYELFFEDAVKAARALDITLTRRGRKEEEDIPMCGIPFHAAENYIARLIKQSYKVAICEQLESPHDAKKRGYKEIVRRDVIRVITAGTLTEDSLLEARQNNFLLALSYHKKSAGGVIGLAAVDISTGELFLEDLLAGSLESALVRLNPKEILISQKLIETPELFECLNSYKSILTPQADSRFDLENSKKRFQSLFNVLSIEVFGEFQDVEIMAAGALLEYIHLTQKGNIPSLNPPKKLLPQDFLQIDAATRRSLELEYTLKGERAGSLLETIDYTVTAMGGRLLARTLAFPLTDPKRINERLDQIEWFIQNEEITKKLREILKSSPDGERLLSRLTLNRGGPRDLSGVKDLLQKGGLIKALFQPYQKKECPLNKLLLSLPSPPGLEDKLIRSLVASPPILAREGGFIAPGYLPELDELRALKDDSRQTIAALQMRYIQETGINSLKIKYNNILGYYIEVTANHKERIPPHFIHRQTLVNGMRFTTPELSEIQEKLNTAGEKALTLELGVFQELVREVVACISDLRELGQALAWFDMISALSVLAVTHNYCRPMVDESFIFSVKEGRHPVVEAMLNSQNQSFVPNNCELIPDHYMGLLTGPNMAGKSTYLRQNALIIVLAQMGSYVPAKEAHIGIVDSLFSRVGASDDLAKGRSTFMVEMVETASILNQATKRSFVILDEIGRGTSTYDGMSLAWATTEYLHDLNQSRSLFATHYHELTALEKTLKFLVCYTMKIKEWEDKVIFLHTIIKGVADRSYGIHVAELAGLPIGVIKKAKVILSTLETTKTSQDLKNVSRETFLEIPSNPILDTLKILDPNSLTPKEALDLIYKLKDLINEKTTP